MPQLDQLAGPVVGAAAGLHPDQARRQAGEERQQLASGQLLAQQRPALRVGAVHLEPGLCEVESDCRNLHHGWPPPMGVVLTPGTVMPKVGTVHPIGFPNSLMRLAMMKMQAVVKRARMIPATNAAALDAMSVSRCQRHG